MRVLLPCCLLFFMTSSVMAQLVSFPVKGKFHISVDDTATLFVNGRQLCRVGINESASPETLLEPGDRVVVRLHNKGGPRRFAMIFVSPDQKVIISFRNQMCKIMPDVSKTDFVAREYEGLGKFAEQTNRKEAVRRFAFKNNAEWLWGVGNPCSLGSLVQRDYFRALTP